MGESQIVVGPTMHSQSCSIMVFADDLTGACDSAVAFLKRGLRAQIMLKLEARPAADVDVLSYSTETRNLSGPPAEERIRSVLQRLENSSPEILFKKIDSAGRGNIGAEVLYTLRASPCAWVLFAPAFPAQGRTVQEGILFVSELPHERVDRRHRVELAAFFPSEVQDMLWTIPIGNAVQHETSLRTALSMGKKILLCDAVTDEDLAALVKAARNMQSGQVLWCGSAGLAHALAASLPGPAFQESRPMNGPDGVHLVFAGTQHPTTDLQLEALKAGADAFVMDAEDRPALFPSQSACIVARVRCGETTGEAIRKVWAAAGAHRGVASLVLTGGDTAFAVLQALGADAIHLQGEISPGIPWGVLEGGLAHGCRVITKSGGFGAKTALLEAVTFQEMSA